MERGDESTAAQEQQHADLSADVFVSYAHDDAEWVMALAAALQDTGFSVTYDRYVLRAGDSLIDRLAQAITDGAFVVAVISPSSINSGWCQKEINLAMTEGINERHPKVIPIRILGAPVPERLKDTFCPEFELPDEAAAQLAGDISSHRADRGASEQAPSPPVRVSDAVEAQAAPADAQAAPALDWRTGEAPFTASLVGLLVQEPSWWFWRSPGFL